MAEQVYDAFSIINIGKVFDDLIDMHPDFREWFEETFPSGTATKKEIFDVLRKDKHGGLLLWYDAIADQEISDALMDKYLGRPWFSKNFPRGGTKEDILKKIKEHQYGIIGGFR